MGRYIDWNNITQRYPDITKIGGAAEVGSSYIYDAEAEVDARLAVRYPVPFSPVPDMIRGLTVDLAYYKATWQQEVAAILKTSLDERFAGLINGTITLTVSGSAIAGSDRAWTDRNFSTVFGPDDPLNWQENPDWNEAVQDERP